MSKFLGPGSKPVMEHLLDKMCSSAGIERSSVQSLEQCLAEARRKLH
jgi:hypothetical protein